MMEEAESQASEGGEGASGNSFFDNHDEWLSDPSEAAGGSQEIAEQKAKQILQKATNEATKAASWGMVSAEM